ncbi:BamA/TamA family outer membrane protein [Verticiella sediminum]|uniref:BamA/TamA family outer membrane protein n=1 Tax=Verticiella sediminum TaxID=1247510 RepID=A0A556AKP5_9BURK|nr:BamA/TamA family outer membrane protein [Verticiella sediminum]TSH93461.1 BamA/TamA family outer membrane protein [Verticiella sediminum]
MGAVQAQQTRPEVTIDPGGVPPAVLQAVTKAVDHIISLSQDQDGGEVDRLRRRARDVTITALATEGYFSPDVTLQAGTDIGGETWDITIRPGERSVISSVDLGFAGAISHDRYSERVERMRTAWSLPVGADFRSEQWETAKRDLIGSVSEEDFAFARIDKSEARVDADAARVDLTVHVASGPEVILGELQTEGLRRVPSRLVRRYVTYEEGQTRYNRRDMIRWQQDMQSTSFFSSADVALARASGRRTIQQVADQMAEGEGAGDLDAMRTPPEAGQPRDTQTESSVDEPGERRAGLMDMDSIVVPVRTTVVEAPARRVGVSIGADTDVGVGFETSYRQNVVLGQPVELQSGLGLDLKRQIAFADIYLPPSPEGYRDSVGVRAEHYDISGQDLQRVAFGGTRSRTRHGAGDSRVEYETRTSALLAYDKVNISGGDKYTLPSVNLTQQWLRRDVDNRYNPRSGNLIELVAGVGTSVREFNPYTRLYARGQQWWPIGERDLITVRGEVGKVWSRDGARVPDDFRFRTGGARTIRGYRYLRLGLEEGDATVGAPTLAVGSVEYQHFFTDMLGVGVFVDAGDAAASFRDMDIAWSVGSGLRVRTPAGPIFVDLAWADRDKRLRLSFSLGLAF